MLRDDATRFSSPLSPTPFRRSLRSRFSFTPEYARRCRNNNNGSSYATPEHMAERSFLPSVYTSPRRFRCRFIASTLLLLLTMLMPVIARHAACFERHGAMLPLRALPHVDIFDACFLRDDAVSFRR